MNPQLVILIAEALIKYGPDVARGLRDIFSKDTVTKEDWDAVFTLAAAKSYDDYVKSI